MARDEKIFCSEGVTALHNFSGIHILCIVFEITKPVPSMNWSIEPQTSNI